MDVMFRTGRSTAVSQIRVTFYGAGFILLKLFTEQFLCCERCTSVGYILLKECCTGRGCRFDEENIRRLTWFWTCGLGRRNSDSGKNSGWPLHNFRPHHKMLQFESKFHKSWLLFTKQLPCCERYTPARYMLLKECCTGRGGRFNVH